MAEKTPEEKHLEIMLAIGEVKTTLKKIVEPAVEQTYNNKDNIIRIQSFQKVVKWIGGTVGVATIYTTVKMIYSTLSKH